MEEETTKEIAPVVPSSEAPASMPEGDDNGLVSDEEFDQKLNELKKIQEQAKANEQENGTGSGLIDHMITLAKRTAGYNYITVSRIEKIPEDSKKYSLLLQQMLVGFMLRKGKNMDDFKKLFVHNEVVFFQAHKELPTLAEDGLYSCYDPDGHHIKSITSLDNRMITSPDTFEPFVLVKRGSKDGEMQYGIIKGNPYHTFTPDEQKAALEIAEKPE